jgi:hypothetical protein
MPDQSWFRDITGLPYEVVEQCPHHVMEHSDHYRDDGSCRCDDPTDIAMAIIGFRWDALQRRWTD